MKPHTSPSRPVAAWSCNCMEIRDEQLSAVLCFAPQGRMSELSDEASESELLSRSLSMWHGVGPVLCHEELDVPLDLHTASSIGQYHVVQECIQR